MSMAHHDDIPERALEWHRAGTGAVLATVIETWGSAPRPVGSQLAISGTGEIAGSVSGGCVEGAVVVEAIEALETGGDARVLDFGVSDDEAFAVGLACGGRIRVLVEPVGGALSEALLAELVALRARHEAVAYVVDLEHGARHLERPPSYSERFRLDRSGFEPETQRFVAIHNPPLRMMVIGGVHIAQPLVEMARLAGYDVVLIDPRESFASAARFPGLRLVHDWPDTALEAERLDARCAVVTLTHDPKLDDPALRVALHAPVFYIGSLGSTRTHAKRLARLQEDGFGEGEVGRIHAPVGLDIGARSPAEIAVAIMAEITQRLRQG